MIYVLQSLWNQSITDALSKAAERVLKDSPYPVEVIQVPGALEIPLVAKWLFEHSPSDFTGAVACACVIKGDTYHFDLVANESARGLQDVSLDISKPITNAILAVYDQKDAFERARDGNNKGEEAAQSLLAMLKLEKMLKERK